MVITTFSHHRSPSTTINNPSLVDLPLILGTKNQPWISVHHYQPPWATMSNYQPPLITVNHYEPCPGLVTTRNYWLWMTSDNWVRNIAPSSSVVNGEVSPCWVLGSLQHTDLNSLYMHIKYRFFLKKHGIKHNLACKLGVGKMICLKTCKMYLYIHYVTLHYLTLH